MNPNTMNMEFNTFYEAQYLYDVLNMRNAKAGFLQNTNSKQSKSDSPAKIKNMIFLTQSQPKI